MSTTTPSVDGSGSAGCERGGYGGAKEGNNSGGEGGGYAYRI